MENAFKFNKLNVEFLWQLNNEIRKWVRRNEKQSCSYFFKKFSGEWKEAKMNTLVMWYLRKDSCFLSSLILK